MIREIIGAKTITSMLMPKRRRKRKMMMPSVSAMGILAGAGIAYMAIRRNKSINEEEIEE
jgi:predicted metal-binding membrane protein